MLSLTLWGVTTHSSLSFDVSSDVGMTWSLSWMIASASDGLRANETADGKVFSGEAKAGVIGPGGGIADAVLCDVELVGLFGV